MVVTMQRGDILIGNDRSPAGAYIGINIEVWRDGVFMGLLESSLAHGWDVDPFIGNSERIGVDRDGNVYVGGSSSNSGNAGCCIYTWDSDGVWRGKEATVLPFKSPWGEDIGLVSSDGIWPDVGAGLPRDTRCHWIHGTRDGHLYVTRWRHVEGPHLFVQRDKAIPFDGALAKYDIAGNPVQKYNATHEWSPVPDSGTATSTNVDILAAVVTCDERYFVCVSQVDHLLGGFGSGLGPQLLRYDITDPTDQVATLLYQGVGGDFTGLAIDSMDDKIIVLNSFTESPPTIKRISVDGSVIETITLNGVPAFILNLQYYLSPNQVIVSADGSVFLVDITKPDDAGDAWSTPSATPLFTTLGNYMVMGVYDPLRCQRGVSSVFGTVIGAT